MKKRYLAMLAGACSLFFNSYGQTMQEVSPFDIHPTRPGWEERYQKRLDSISTTNVGASGNRPHTEPLAKAFIQRNNSAAQDALFNRSLLTTDLCVAFQNQGLPSYYFHFYKLLSQGDKDAVKNHFYKTRTCGTGAGAVTGNGFDVMARPDHQGDLIYPQGTEFNSENYHWMYRMAGYLFAEEFNDTKALPYYTNFVKNLGRMLYRKGRNEWNSGSYWIHTMSPLMGLYNHSKNTEIKKIAHASLDWMMLENALHFIDGSTVGADVRAKAGAYKPLAAHQWTYGYAYFADENYSPTYNRDFNDPIKSDMEDFMAFGGNSTYRPPQQIVDIAQGNYKHPVELNSVKPFYKVDFGEYASWRGESDSSRRFVFETIYIDTNYLMSSSASERPDGQIGTFSEESVWRLGVKGTTYGVAQITGNSGPMNTVAGRSTHEQIGQFRNTMLRLIKNIDNIWTIVPKEYAIEWIGNKAFVDMGHGVYIAFIPYNAIENNEVDFSDPTQHKLIWKFNPNDLGGVAMEVGVARDFQTYTNFKSKFTTGGKFTREGNTDTLNYAAVSGNTLRMGYMPASTYKLYIENGRVVNPAGVKPKVWGNGKYIDYSKFNSWEVVYGEDIVRQDWGSGILTLRTQGKGLQIQVDDEANVTYKIFDQAPQFITSNKAKYVNTGYNFPAVYPNPTAGETTVTFTTTRAQHVTLDLYDLAGRKLATLYEGKPEPSLTQVLKLNSGELAGQGTYILKLKGEDFSATQRLVVVK